MGGSSNRVETGGLSALVFYQDEELTAFEVGFKSSFLDNRAQITGAVYYYDYRDYQDHVERWESESADFALPPGIDSAPGGSWPSGDHG